MTDFPVWVRVIAAVGFPIALAIWLMASVGPHVTHTAAALDRHEQATTDHTHLLQAICRHTARTELERRDCYVR